MTFEHGDLERTRSEEQRKAYAGTVGQGKCPFCDPLPEDIQSRMILSGRHWRAWHNPFPYPGHASHIMLAPLRHLTQPDALSPEAGAEWFALTTQLIQELNLPGGGLVMRFGGHEYKGGSLTHLHSHIQVPDQTTFSIATFYADPALKAFFAAQSQK